VLPNFTFERAAGSHTLAAAAQHDVRPMGAMHIANINWADFFRPAFPDLDASRAFIECVEAVPAATSKAKIVIHQAARMLWLGDRMDEVATGRPALQVLFQLIAAEAVAKLANNFTAEGESRKHVRLFFEDICSDSHRTALGKAFSHAPGGPFLSVREAVDCLYDIRCDVVHEGVYFTLTLTRPGDTLKWLTPSASGKGSLIAGITVQQLRQIVLEGAIRGAVRLLPAGSLCAQLAP